MKNRAVDLACCCLMAVISTCLILSTTARSLDDPIPYTDYGKNYIWAWHLELALGVVGVVYNAICISMMLTLKDSSKMSFYSINVAVNAIDLTFSLERVVFSSIYLYYERIYGGSKTCEIEAYLNNILLIWTLFRIIGMSFVARYEICYGYKLTELQMTMLMCFSGTYSIGITAMTIYVPQGGFELGSSGTYCEVALSSRIGAPLLYAIGWIFPMVVLFYNLSLTYSSIQRAQAVLELHNIKEQAKGRYIQMVMKMKYFLFATMQCISPFFYGSIYEWWTNQYVPGWYTVFAGSCAMLLGGFINPSLFFYLNADLRDRFWETIGIRIFKLLQYVGVIKCLIGGKLAIPRNRLVSVKPISSTSGFKGSQSIKLSIENFEIQYKKHFNMLRIESGSLDYNDVNTWLSEPTLLEAFKEHGRREYSTENFLFYEDVKIYSFKGIDLLTSINNFLSERDKHVIEYEFPDSLMNSWTELEVQGVRIYELYIKVPTAPLEINISHGLRSKLRKIFDPLNKGQSLYPSLRDCDADGQDILTIAEKYVHIFDESINVVKQIIESGVWPRFRVSKLYRTAKASHQKDLV